MIYLWWNVWKERNRRIFQNILMQPRQVAFLCKEEIEQHQLAMRNHGESNSINNFSYSCVISGVCLALEEALFVFSRWAGGTG